MRDVYYVKLLEWRDSGEDTISLVEQPRDLINYETSDPVEQKKIDNAFTSMWPTRIQSFYSFGRTLGKGYSLFATFCKETQVSLVQNGV